MKTLMPWILAASLPALSYAAAPLNAEQSNPLQQGWMIGFPPAVDKTIRFTDVDYFAFPKLRWTVCHFQQLMPTMAVDNGPRPAPLMPSALNKGIDNVTFTPLNSTTPMTWKDSLAANYTDGIIVLHHGQVVYEHYDGCLTQRGQHAAMSVTKSLTGLLGETLVADGVLDENALVGDLIPELKNSAFADATVRQVLNMTTALDYSEDYSDPNAQVWQFAQAGSPLPKPADYQGPRSYFEFLQGVKKDGQHDQAFGYKTINSDVLGWIISRATNKSVAQLLSERIWQPMGATREAFYTVDSIGTPFAGGGFNATLRDIARLGQIMLNNGEQYGERIIPRQAIARIQQGGDPALFAKAGYNNLPGWSYAGMWWVSHDDHGAYSARGVHGQTLWVDPKADMVIARFASHPIASNSANDATSLPAYRAVAEYLMTQDKSVLQGDEWVIEDLNGHGMMDYSHATVQFLPDGRLVGSGGCNRLMGRYQQEQGELSLEVSGTTRKSCAEALMNQEHAVLELLGRIKHYRLEDTRTLRLISANGDYLLARR